MQAEYQKQAFVLPQISHRIQVPKRLAFQSVTKEKMDALIALVARVMAESLDRSDQHAVRRQGAVRAASEFLAEAAENFDYRPDWWKLALDQSGQLVGFVLPAFFRGAQKEGLGEGTFYYLGVAPQHRGNNYGFDLLCHGTATLQDAGVWRIYSDTDILNLPMIAAFKEAGYQTFGKPKKVTLDAAD